VQSFHDDDTLAILPSPFYEDDNYPLDCRFRSNGLYKGRDSGPGTSCASQRSSDLWPTRHASSVVRLMPLIRLLVNRELVREGIEGGGGEGERR
jgi:hypothetical protein